MRSDPGRLTKAGGLGRAGAGLDSPTAVLRPSMGWVKGTAEDAKEGGNNVVAPHENTARVHEATRGALVGAGIGRDPALGRLPGGIRGHDVAFGQVHARRRSIFPVRAGLPLGQHPGGNSAGTDAGHGNRAAAAAWNCSAGGRRARRDTKPGGRGRNTDECQRTAGVACCAATARAGQRSTRPSTGQLTPGKFAEHEGSDRRTRPTS